LPLLGFAVALAAPAYADGSQLDLSGAYDTYIGAPTGNYPLAYDTTVDDLYLKPLGDTGPVTPLDLPTGSYNYGTTVPQGETQIENTVLADYNAGHLSAAHPDVLFGYSDSSVMISGAEATLHADGVPTQDLDIVLVGDTSNPVTGYLATWAEQNATLLKDLGMGNLVGLTTPDNYYPTDIYTIKGDEFADYTDYNWLTDGNVHDLYPGLTEAQINTATEVTTGLTNSFTIDLPASDFGTALWDAFMNVYG
jgi:hypothetical protein